MNERLVGIKGQAAFVGLFSVAVLHERLCKRDAHEHPLPAQPNTPEQTMKCDSPALPDPAAHPLRAATAVVGSERRRACAAATRICLHPRVLIH